MHVYFLSVCLFFQVGFASCLLINFLNLLQCLNDLERKGGCRTCTGELDVFAFFFTFIRSKKLQVGEGEMPSRLSSSFITLLGHRLPVAMATDFVQPDNCFPDQVTSHLTAGQAGLHAAKEVRLRQTPGLLNDGLTLTVLSSWEVDS